MAGVRHYASQRVWNENQGRNQGRAPASVRERAFGPKPEAPKIYHEPKSNYGAFGYRRAPTYRGGSRARPAPNRGGNAQNISRV